jgi:CRP-like cAMP-binding protein
MIHDQSEASGTVAHGATALSALHALNLPGSQRTAGFRKDPDRYRPGAALLGPFGSAQPRLAIVSGWACEVRASPKGRRQIFSFALPGDIVDLASVVAGQRSLLALTRVEVLDVAAVLPEEEPARAEMQALLEAAIREREARIVDRIARMRQLKAKERVLDLLQEFHERLRAAGLTRKGAFRLPLTHEVLAEALGLSLVTLHRALEQLRSDGVIGFCCGEITVRARRRAVRARSRERLAPGLLPLFG